MPATLQLLTLQVFVVVAVARLCGHLFRRIGQPTVVGEMFGGILLGPSVFGTVAPSLFHGLFPTNGLRGFFWLSQAGLLVFMFNLGLQVDLVDATPCLHSRVKMSIASFATPFALGMAVGWFVYPRLSVPAVSPWAFALFIGLAMCVTAFPVLARILAERDLLSSVVGSLAIACAAVDDVMAWCVLSLLTVVARTPASTYLVGMRLAGVILYIFSMLVPIRRRLRRDCSGQYWMPFLICSSVFVAESLGLHATIGAFLAGVALPPRISFRGKVPTFLDKAATGRASTIVLRVQRSSGPRRPTCRLEDISVCRSFLSGCDRWQGHWMHDRSSNCRTALARIRHTWRTDEYSRPGGTHDSEYGIRYGRHLRGGLLDPGASRIADHADDISSIGPPVPATQLPDSTRSWRSRLRVRTTSS